ncbi:hypothetical protein [Colwellia sp. TT2012]|uniref:hypothetical protein n=1 Tax=Colwellia sp. TT2012 TaxID=1720342 RepID=UPI0007108EEB|nr:hypothetical protein [Colwellia sp. TT2012]
MSSAIKNTKNLTGKIEIDRDERRHVCPSTHALWTQLSVAQQASVSSMYNYGYELSFIRTQDEITQVVMLLNEAVIAIDEEGTINTQVSIHIRK